MRVLVDTNILVRILEPSNRLHSAAVESLAKLRNDGDLLYIVPQNLVEFWAIATRPLEANGLGLDTSTAKVQIDMIKLHFPLLNENETLYDKWEELVVAHQVKGKATHDARIVAAMLANSLDTILTFNVADFHRYASAITIISPLDMVEPI
ncbi:MAG: type II toxin-antitoxin system VapC family toxin [Acidobacteriota bacterium]|nr:MAG: type II toxin-antitoxin system VapC family toxin [Acidobacteriota bacterium]